MTPENFVYWLQGYFEISNEETHSLNSTKVRVIKEHIALVLKKEMPDKKVFHGTCGISKQL